ncbi:MAG: putative bifunctional diguanylate cyclase/phosphodiesterase [Pyrinomonadaceae bacterium]
MKRASNSNIAKALLIALGAVAIVMAAASIPYAAITPGLLTLLAFATLLAPRMSLTLPGSRFALSFSDAAIFLAFILYGGPAAIVLASLESVANCLYLRSTGFKFGKWMVPANVSVNSLTIALTYSLWLVLPRISGISADPGTSPHLFTMLACLALAQFAFSSVLASILFWINGGTDPISTWKRYCYTSSMTQIVGAGLAGLVFKLLSFGDPIAAGIGFVSITVAYFTYRRNVTEVKDAIVQAESAERKKSEAERDGRLQAEQHAQELTRSLDLQEQANAALRKSEQDLQYAAHYDSLTGLANRKQFGDVLTRLIDGYKQDPTQTFHVLFLDIRKFKHINDGLGHPFGDKVLSTVAKRIVRMVNPTDVVARLGGDEFAIVLTNLATVGKAQKVARRIYESLGQPFSLAGNRVSLDLNIGVAPCDVEYEKPQEVLRDADIAMHSAKEKNSGVAVFSKDLRVRFLERIRLENDLRQAIDRDELSMSYQPIIDLSDGSMFGMEALLRWNHTELGQIPPNKFIPIAEESGLIIPMTNWILEETCKQIAHWQQLSPGYERLIVSVNISGKHLSNNDLIDDVENALIESKIDPSSLKLEITESAAMENADHTIRILNQLKKVGVQLSIDDFGTGYSSLSYLHRLPFDTLKIDRSFVSAVGEKREGSEILRTIVSLAKNLKKKVIAEGIETEAQLELLEELGCHYGQGYLMSKPLTVEKMEAALLDKRTWLPETILQESKTPSPFGMGELPVF